MKNKNNSFFKQVKNNSVALISLFIAISSLGYNTWRNEKTEANRNQRQAAFEILVKLNELQQVAFYNHYDKDINGKGNPRMGWTYVLTIQDLSKILYEPIPQSCSDLHKTWEANWQSLESEQASIDTILLGIDKVRTDILSLLTALD